VKAGDLAFYGSGFNSQSLDSKERNIKPKKQE